MTKLSLLIGSAVAATGFAQDVKVETNSGPVVGSASSNVNSWLGIPFAKSPPARFGAPEDPVPWKAPLATKQGKNSCMQQFMYPEKSRNLTIKIFSSPLPVESEDCLYLNVWAPKTKPPPGGFPVMFWIYGGNLQFGHAALPIYDGSNMAQSRNVVVVGANYRTNIFGFPASSEIPAGKANLGFLDQRKSLAWVQKNIAKFGGNPSKVLIFGESAGGYSVKQLVANPPAGALPFHAAIMESQASGVHGDPAVFSKLAKGLGCAAGKGELACVQKADAFKIKDAIERGGHQFGPMPDGQTHVTDVRDSFKSGKAAKVPMIIGTNADEGRPFAAIGLINGGDVVDFFGSFLGDRDAAKAVIENVKPLYPKDKYPNDMEFGSQLFTDIGFQCPTAILTKAIASAGYTAYRYYYTAKYPEEESYPNLGAYHSEEILNIFRTYKPEHKNLDRLGAVMQGIWTDFAKDPSKAPAGWPKLTTTSYQVREFANGADRTVDGNALDAPRCAVIGPLSEAPGI